MKRTFRTKAFTLIVNSLLIGLMLNGWTQAQTSKKPTPTPTPTPERKAPPEDPILRREGKSKIVFKPGFEVVKQSDNRGVVMKKGASIKSGSTLVATIECQCKPDGSGTTGGCAGKITGLTFTCTASGGCSCELVFVPVK